MKQFLKILSIFSCLVLLLAFCVDYAISKGLQKSRDRKYVVWNEICKGGIDADLLVMGSSRAWCMYSTQIIDSMLGCNSYNLGIDGHTIEYQILRYETYCSYNLKPKVIILNVDFFSTLWSKSDSQYEREQFFPYMSNRLLTSKIRELKNISLLECYVPLLRYLGYSNEYKNGLLHYFCLGKDSDAGLYKGYRGNDWTWKEPDADCPIQQLSVENPQLLQSFVADRIKEGVKVILVKAPFHDWMYQHCAGIELSDNVFQSVADTSDCLLLDYYHCELSHDKKFFYNPSHLNKLGSEKFTKQLCNDLINHKVKVNQ